MQGQPLLALRLLVGATAISTCVMLLTKFVVDAVIPRPPPKQKGPPKPKKKRSGSLKESLQVRGSCIGRPASLDQRCLDCSRVPVLLAAAAELLRAVL